MFGRLGRMVESLKSKLEGEDESLRNAIGGTLEELEMLRKTTTSRQKVSDARMDGLESLVMEVSSRPQQSPPAFQPQQLPSSNPIGGGDIQEQFPWIGPTDATTTMRTTTSTASTPPTTEPDFSMLGLGSLSELDQLAPWEEEQEVEQLYRGIRRQRGKVGVEEECRRLRILNGGRWTEGCPMPEIPRRLDRAAPTPLLQERAPPKTFRPPPAPPLPPRPLADCGCDSELQPLLLR